MIPQNTLCWRNTVIILHWWLSDYRPVSLANNFIVVQYTYCVGLLWLHNRFNGFKIYQFSTQIIQSQFPHLARTKFFARWFSDFVCLVFWTPWKLQKIGKNILFCKSYHIQTRRCTSLATCLICPLIGLRSHLWVEAYHSDLQRKTYHQYRSISSCPVTALWSCINAAKPGPLHIWQPWH